MQLLHFFLLLFVSLSHAPATAAGEPGENHREMMEILVTAGRSARLHTDLPAARTVITREEIARSGSRDVPDLLRGVPAVQVTDLVGDGSSTRIGLRGFGENAAGNTLILLDGRRLNNSLDLAPPALSEIMLEDIERIEIIEGSAGALYGDSAVGGVINIVTRGGHRQHLSVHLGGGSYDREAGGVRVRAPLTDALTLHVGARELRTDNYRVRNHREDSLQQLGLDYSDGPARAWLHWSQQDEDLQQAGALFSNRYNQDRRQAQFPGDFVDTERDAARAGLQWDLDENWQALVDYDWREDAAFGRLRSTAFTQDRRQWSLYPRIAGTLPGRTGARQWLFGFDLERAHYTLRSPFGVQQAEQRSQALYAQLGFPILPDLEATVGLRQAWVDTHILDSFTFVGGRNVREREFLKDLGLLWRASARTEWFLRRSESVRFGKVDEHAGQAFGVTRPLEPQTGTSWEAGFRHQRAAVSYHFSAFHLRLEDEIATEVADPSVNPFPVNRNLDPTLRVGWQAGINWALNARTDFALHHAFVNARLDGGPNAGKRIPAVAERNTTASVTRHWSDQLSSTLQFHHQSDRVPDGDDTNQQDDLNGFDRVDFAMRWRQGAWAVSGRVNNLFDERYAASGAAACSTFVGFTCTRVETAFYAAPERNFLLDLRWTPDWR